MKSVFRFVLLALVLLLVAKFSALVAMRYAIHGGEVTVPKLVGLSPAEAQRTLSGVSLSLVVERQYYSSDVPEGKIMSQIPAPETRVRHGWQVRVAQSLGPQRIAIPDVFGQSERAADLNIRRRGLDVGSVSYLQMPDTDSDQVLAQSPPPNASGVSLPRISLLVAAPEQPQAFVMPSFIGQPLGTVNLALLDAGFHVGTVTVVPAQADSVLGGISVSQQNSAPPESSPASIIVSQNPVAGQKVSAGATVSFEVR